MGTKIRLYKTKTCIDISYDQAAFLRQLKAQTGQSTGALLRELIDGEMKKAIKDNDVIRITMSKHKDFIPFWESVMDEIYLNSDEQFDPSVDLI